MKFQRSASLILCILLPSADCLCEQFGPKSGRYGEHFYFLHWAIGSETGVKYFLARAQAATLFCGAGLFWPSDLKENSTDDPLRRVTKAHVS